MSYTRYGTNDELYKLLKRQKPINISVNKIVPMIHTNKEDIKIHPSYTKKPILVRKSDYHITDGNHRYYEAIAQHKKKIKAYIISGKVIEYKDYKTGKIKIKLADKEMII